MNCKEPTRLDMPDIGTMPDDSGREPAPCPPVRPVPPLPFPDEGVRDWVSEGCVCVALLSLATTVISLIMLKGK